MMRESRSAGRAKVLVLAILLMSVAVRLPGMFNDPWLDEIWSLNTARAASGPTAILSDRLDNNHLLNTFYLYVVRGATWWPVYRLLSLGAGLGLLWLIWVRSRAWPAAARVLTLILFCFSYPLIHYSSEARGYEPAALCAAGAFFAMGEWLQRPRRGAMCLFVLASFLGFLSHLTFVYVYGSLLAWSVVRCVRTNGRNPRAGDLALFHAPVLTFAGLLYMAFARGMAIGGGPHTPWWDAVRDAAANVLNVSAPAGVAAFAFLAVAALVFAEITASVRDRDDVWVFFAGLIAAPAFVIAVHHPQLLYARYFSVCIPILLLIVARLLYRLWRAGGAGRWRHVYLSRGLVVAAVLVYLICGAGRLAAFYRYGRGTYRQALIDIASQSPGDVVTISSNQDFQTSMLIRFFRDYIPGTKRIVFISSRDAQARPADWYLYRVYPGIDLPPPELVVDDEFYDRAATYRTGGEVGWNWVVYRKM